MIKGQDNIIGWYDLMKYPYWKLCSPSNSKQVIAMSEGSTDDDDDKANKGPSNNLSLDSGRAQLMEFLKILDKGRYTLKLSKDGKGGSGWIQDLVDSSDGSAPAVGAIGSNSGMLTGYVSKADVEALIAKEKAAWLLESQIKELKEQIKELKSGTAGMDPGWQKFFTVMEPHMGSVVQGLFPGTTPAQVGVSGFKKTGDKNAPSDIKSIQDRLEIALEKVQGQDEGAEEKFVDMMEKLADLKQNNPAMYNMGLNALLSQS